MMDRNSILSLALICIAIAADGARSPKSTSPDVSPAHSHLVATPVSSPPASFLESSPSDHVLVKSSSAPAPAPTKHKGKKKNPKEKKHHAPSPSSDGSHKHSSKKHNAPSPSPSKKHSSKAPAPSPNDQSGAESIMCLKKLLGFLALGWVTLVFIF